MIIPRSAQTAKSVARHHDVLDRLYREIWGVHHGLWRTGRETPHEAVEALTALVAQRLELEPGQAVCDVGCGYSGNGAAAGRPLGLHRHRTDAVGEVA